MATDDLRRAYKRLKLLPFYKDGNVFKLDLDNLNSILETYEKFQNDVYWDLDVEDNISMEQLKEVYDKKNKHSFEDKVTYNLIVAYNKLYDELSKLCIPQDDFNAYLKSKTLSDSIIAYQNIKKRFKYALQSYDMTLMTRYGDTEDKTIETESKSTQVVLNNKNPFADISIKNQQYLYPDKEGKFKTLSFNIGYTMSKTQKEDTESIVLSPDFKILKTDKRDGFETSITMDDSITSPIQDTKGDIELLYI